LIYDCTRAWDFHRFPGGNLDDSDVAWSNDTTWSTIDTGSQALRANEGLIDFKICAIRETFEGFPFLWKYRFIGMVIKNEFRMWDLVE
jgi:hypothetical protein